MIPVKTYEEILSATLKGVTQETDINQVGPGTVIRGISSAFAKELAKAFSTQRDAFLQQHLTHASGLYLDLIGQTFGLIRRGKSQAIVRRADRTIKFYVNSATLGEALPHPTNLNLGRIPAGTTVFGPNGITFVVDDDYDFPSATQEAFAGAISTGKGSGQNVGVGDLSSHDLGVSGVFVTNPLAITTGSELESDEEFRFRISQYVTSSAGQNEAAVRLAVLSVTGVADVIRQPWHAGAGSFRLTIIPVSNRVPVETLRQVRGNVAAVAADGTFFQVEEPRYIAISLSMRLVPRKDASITAVDRDLVEQAIRRLVGNTRPGESFIINRLRAEALGATTNIADVRLQSISLNRRPQALVNFDLDRDELLVPDEELEDPILVV